MNFYQTNEPHEENGQHSRNSYDAFRFNVKLKSALGKPHITGYINFMIPKIISVTTS